jgi:hypothetical protein
MCFDTRKCRSIMVVVHKQKQVKPTVEAPFLGLA